MYNGMCLIKKKSHRICLTIPCKVIAPESGIACATKNQSLNPENTRWNDTVESVRDIYAASIPTKSIALKVAWFSPLVFQEARGKGRNEEIHPVTSCRVRWCYWQTVPLYRPSLALSRRRRSMHAARRTACITMDMLLITPIWPRRSISTNPSTDGSCLMTWVIISKSLDITIVRNRPFNY